MSVALISNIRPQYSREDPSLRAIYAAREFAELEVEITAKAKQGKEFVKTTWINSQTAKRWQKDGSLVVEVETVEEGGYGSITATRTVVLGFDKTDKARILKSSIKFAIEKD